MRHDLNPLHLLQYTTALLVYIYEGFLCERIEEHKQESEKKKHNTKLHVYMKWT